VFSTELVAAALWVRGFAKMAKDRQQLKTNE